MQELQRPPGPCGGGVTSPVAEHAPCGLCRAPSRSREQFLCRWFNGVQLVSLAASLWLCYWNWKSKQANVLDSVGYAPSHETAGFPGV